VSCELDVLDERGRTVVRGQIDVIWRRGEAAVQASDHEQDTGAVVPL